jgi:ribosomal protein S27E
MAEGKRSEWMCINCGDSLGQVFGGEFFPSVDGKYLRTSGPNLEVTCPNCGQRKTFYTADPIVRAIYQLTDAVATQAARRMVETCGAQMLNQATRLATDAVTSQIRELIRQEVERILRTSFAKSSVKFDV